MVGWQVSIFISRSPEISVSKSYGIPSIAPPVGNPSLKLALSLALAASDVRLMHHRQFK